MKKKLNVVVGILLDGDKILLNSRPDGKDMSGYWEFPGGKIELGESNVDAVIRELYEELSINIGHDSCKYVSSIEQDYEHAFVCLDLVLVSKWSGVLRAKENQTLSWQSINNEITVGPLLPTTEKIIAIIKNL
ncbi:MAG: NUDIX domain-containing protein [Burkholderiales bacterium]|nr:NUDIX domain-containing protein [Burkholderiales bacterium]